MWLTNEQIITAVNGYVRVEQNELGVEFHRFSREQEAFFYKTHPLYCHESFFNGYFGRNCRTCAGIAMDFISDAKRFQIKFGKIEYPNDAKNQFFDLYIDNNFVQSYPAENEIVYKSSGKKCRFTLYFPHFAFPIVSSVELSEATVFMPTKKPVDILFLGDSITQGVNAVYPSNTYVMRVARNLDVGIINQGNSGFVYDAGSIDKVCEPKVIVTAYGINDYGRKTIGQLESQTTEFIQRLREAYEDAKILSILPLWNRDDEQKDYRVEERACLRKVYEEYSDYIVDGHKMMPHDKKYLEDRVQPNDDGFQHYGNNLTEELKKILSVISKKMCTAD